MAQDDDQRRARMQSRIADRFDLTVECIRRHYLGEPSPLVRRLPGTQTSSLCSATSLDTWTSSTCKTWWTRPPPRSSSSRRSRTSPRRRCREPSMRTSRIANARLSSSNRVTGGSPLTSARETMRTIHSRETEDPVAWTGSARVNVLRQRSTARLRPYARAGDDRSGRGAPRPPRPVCHELHVH